MARRWPAILVAAGTLGCEHRVHATTRTEVALGADLTLYRTPANLRDAHGRPVSWHVFARLALR